MKLTLSKGTRLGPYLIDSPAGSGGMGEVYKARDTRLDRTIAIKVLPPHIADHTELRQRFDREAKAISSLNHPHICTLHDVGQAEGINYLVMEYLEGETLAERIKRSAIAPDEMFRWAIQIGDALSVAHERGLIHRDLKPGNVIIAREGAKLLDFGLAKLQGPTGVSEGLTQTTPLTGSGTLLGTLHYMAPEQLEGGEADARSDIFAFGAMLYEMVTGQKAFDGKSQASLIAAILEREPRRPSELIPTTPPALDRVITKCLAKDPGHRWQSAHDLVDELRWIAEGGADSEAGSRTARWHRFRDVAGWVLAAAAVATAVTAYLLPRGESHLPAVRAIVAAPPDAVFLLEGDNAGPPVVSPDGKRIAFVAVSPAGARVWVREVSNLAPRELPGTEGASFPFWSPDSKSLGFFAGGRLKRVDISNGQVFSICTVTAGGRGASWGKGDVIVFSPDWQADIFRVSAAGGTPVQVTFRDTLQHTTHRWPSMLPDGEHFLYFAGDHSDPDGPRNSVWCTSLDGKENHLVLASLSDAAYADGLLFFVRDSVLFAQKFEPGPRRLAGEPRATRDRPQTDRTTWKANFSVSDAGVLVYQLVGGKQGAQILMVDRSGKTLRTIGPRGNHYNLCLSRQERGVIYSSQELPYGELYYFDLDREVNTRLTFETQDKDYPVLSPSGDRVAYTVDPGGTGPSHYEVRSLFINGAAGEERVARDSAHDMWPFDWSMDGRYLLCGVGALSASAALELVLVPMTQDAHRIRVSGITGEVVSARLSRDGRWIAFSAILGGTEQVFVMPSPSQAGSPSKENGRAGRWQISTTGGGHPRWRADGRELYYIRSDGAAMAVDVSTEGSVFRVGHEAELFRAAMRVTTECWEPSHDGQRFVLNVLAGESSTPVILVQNWAEGMVR